MYIEIGRERERERERDIRRERERCARTKDRNSYKFTFMEIRLFVSKSRVTHMDANYTKLL